MRTNIAFSLLAAIALGIGIATPASADRPSPAPRAAFAPANVAPTETAYFAGGCFWGVEGVFEQVKGVKSAVSGYQGGRTDRPSYEAVSAGATGHAETVRVTFDPRVVSYADLLRVYVSVIADPTLLNRQGPDRGTQYRTALFPTSPRQARIARAYFAQLARARTFDRPIVTSIEQGRFWEAEAYHQDYMRRNPRAPYIVVHDAPKLAAFRRFFPAMAR